MSSDNLSPHRRRAMLILGAPDPAPLAAVVPSFDIVTETSAGELLGDGPMTADAIWIGSAPGSALAWSEVLGCCHRAALTVVVDITELEPSAMRELLSSVLFVTEAGGRLLGVRQFSQRSYLAVTSQPTNPSWWPMGRTEEDKVGLGWLAADRAPSHPQGNVWRDSAGIIHVPSKQAGANLPVKARADRMEAKVKNLRSRLRVRERELTELESSLMRLEAKRVVRLALRLESVRERAASRRFHALATAAFLVALCLFIAQARGA